MDRVGVSWTPTVCLARCRYLSQCLSLSLITSLKNEGCPPPCPCHPHALLVAASAGDMKPEAVLPSTVHASRKRPAIASAGAGKRLASDPLETKLSATRKGSFLPSVDPAVPPHTLLLGTQPSDNSLAHGQYFMTNANAFWHIVGGPACSKCLTRSSGPSRHPRGPPARSGLPSWVREESRPVAP